MHAIFCGLRKMKYAPLHPSLRQYNALKFSALYVFPFFVSISLPSYIFIKLNWFNHTTRSKSIDSIFYFMKTNRLNHQPIPLENEFNQFNEYLRANKSIHANRINRVDWYLYKSGCDDIGLCADYKRSIDMRPTQIRLVLQLRQPAVVAVSSVCVCRQSGCDGNRSLSPWAISPSEDPLGERSRDGPDGTIRDLVLALWSAGAGTGAF